MGSLNVNVARPAQAWAASPSLAQVGAVLQCSATSVQPITFLMSLFVESRAEGELYSQQSQCEQTCQHVVVHGQACAALATQPDEEGIT